MYFSPILLIVVIGCIVMGAVSFDSSSPNTVIEEELKRLNENVEKLIIMAENKNKYSDYILGEHTKLLNKIAKSLQPNAFDVNWELREE